MIAPNRDTCMPTERIAARSSGSTPDASLATNHGYGRRELRDIERLVRENLELLRNEWDEFCRGYIS
jgi:hypothetical protein